MKYLKFGLLVFVVLLFCGCNSALKTGSNMQAAQKAVAEGRVNETFGGMTGLDYAVTKPHNARIIRYLIENGANISTEKCRLSALETAINYEYTNNQHEKHLTLLDNIEILLKYGSNCKDYALLDTLVYANGSGTNKHIPLVNMLISYGADPHKKQIRAWSHGRSVSAAEYTQRLEAKKNKKNKNHELFGKIVAIGMGAAIADSSSIDDAAKVDFMTSYSTDVLNDDMSMRNTKQWKDKTVQQNQPGTASFQESKSNAVQPCKKEDYPGYMEGKPQLAGDCKMAWFNSCNKAKYPRRAAEFDQRIRMYCSALDGYVSKNECPACSSYVGDLKIPLSPEAASFNAPGKSQSSQKGYYDTENCNPDLPRCTINSCYDKSGCDTLGM